MGLSVEEQRTLRVEMLKARYCVTIRKAEKVLTEANAKASSVKDRSVEENKNSSSKDQETRLRGPILEPKKAQERKALKVERPQKADVPKFMAFNDREKVAEVERQAKAILLKRRRRQEIERQRLAAPIEINDVAKTVDFDNLGVINDFEKLVCPHAWEYSYGSLLT